MGYSRGSLVSDYSNLRTLPALLSVAFVIAGLYQFGGIDDVHFAWLDYTLTTSDSMLTSLGVYAMAFASSETRDFDYYDGWEKGLIAAAPILVITYEVTQFVPDLFTRLGDPLGNIVAFLITLAGWGVAVR